MPIQKGSIIVADGNGKVTAITPTDDNDILILDSTQPYGIKFGNSPGTNSLKQIKNSLAGKDNFNLSSYEAAIEMTLPGGNLLTITKIYVLSYMTSNINSYDVQIYDLTNDMIIASKNFTNTSTQKNDMGTLSNLPLNESIVEIQVKINYSGNNNNKYAYVKEVILEYD